ncbi:MAG: hypothetical protein WC683_08125 [bacterium]
MNDDNERALAAFFAPLCEAEAASALSTVLAHLPEGSRLCLEHRDNAYVLTLDRGPLGAERHAGIHFSRPEALVLRFGEMRREYADDRTAEQVAALLAEGEAEKVLALRLDELRRRVGR